MNVGEIEGDENDIIELNKEEEKDAEAGGRGEETEAVKSSNQYDAIVNNDKVAGVEDNE